MGQAFRRVYITRPKSASIKTKEIEEEKKWLVPLFLTILTSREDKWPTLPGTISIAAVGSLIHSSPVSSPAAVQRALRYKRSNVSASLVPLGATPSNGSNCSNVAFKCTAAQWLRS